MFCAVRNEGRPETVAFRSRSPDQQVSQLPDLRSPITAADRSMSESPVLAGVLADRLQAPGAASFPHPARTRPMANRTLVDRAVLYLSHANIHFAFLTQCR